MKKIINWGKRSLYTLLKQDGISVCLYVIIFITLILYNHQKIMKLEILDWTIFFAMVAVAFVQTIAKIIQQALMNHIEDSVKLEENYEKLCKMYPEIEYE